MQKTKSRLSSPSASPAGDFPSAVYLIAERGKVVFADALGDAVREPQKIPATMETIYDLASLTKPLVTGLLCARRIESGELTLEASVSHYLPEFDRPDKNMITVRDLLTHTAGLPAWRPLYVIAEGKREATIGGNCERETRVFAANARALQRSGFHHARLPARADDRKELLCGLL